MKLVPVGLVVAVHGIKGEVKLRYYNAVSALPEYPSFFADIAGTRMELKPSRVSGHGNTFLVKFKGFDTAEEAGILVKRELSVAEKDLPVLGEDEYYDYQLIGLDVVTDRRRVIGKVKAVMHTKANDILVVEGHREVLVPLTEKHIVSIDKERSLVQIREETIVE